MAAEGKKLFKIRMGIDPLGELRGEKGRGVLAMIPGGYHRILAPILVQESLELDPRKWKQKDLEYEVNGMAKPSLQVFAVKLQQMEKAAEGKLPPAAGKKRDWASVGKSKAPMDKKIAKEAEDKIKKTWLKLAKDIESAISIRLEDIEADKGDNKKAIKDSKAAIDKFNKLDTNAMFAWPVEELSDAMKLLARNLSGSNPDVQGALRDAEKSVAEVQKDVDKRAKEIQSVAKFFLDAGKKMAKDDKSDPVFKKVGQTILNETPNLQALSDNVDALEKLIKQAEGYAKNEKAAPSSLQQFAKAIEADGSRFVKSVKVAVASVGTVSKAFQAAQKEVKA